MEKMKQKLYELETKLAQCIHEKEELEKRLGKLNLETAYLRGVFEGLKEVVKQC